MNYVVFDLEWNRLVKAVKLRCPDEIIQIGAVKYDSNMQCIGTFNRLISPVVYNRLEPTVEKLTGLSMSILKAEGVPFAKATKEFKKFIGTDSVLMSWGAQDAQILRKNCRFFNPDAKLTFMCDFVNVQRYVTHILTKDQTGGNQLSVKLAADMTGIHYEEERLHDALVDATVSGMVFAKIFDKELLQKYIVDASTKNCNFKDVPITDLSNKMVDKRAFKLRCPKCGRYMRKKEPWVLAGTKFVASHSCRKCRRQYLCSVEVLNAYGNIIKYKKRIRPVKTEKVVAAKN